MENLKRNAPERRPMFASSHASSMSRREDIAQEQTYYAPYFPINPLKVKGWSIWNPFKVEDGRDIETAAEVNRTFPNQVGTQVESTERVFQDKINLCSEIDIIKGCQTLNHAIYETALTLVDEWSKTPHNRDGLAQISLSTDDQEHLHHILGGSLFRRIQRARSSSSSRDLEGWVTDALQVIAVDICYRTISHTFCPCLSRATNDEMQGVFDEILSKESQATAFRWRALAYIHSSRDGAIERFIADSVAEMEQYFSSLFVLAGEDNSAVFLARIHREITENRIIESALSLSKALKTGLFSVHLDMYRVQPGRTYRKGTMELTSGQQELREGIHVLCTTELGIREIPSDTKASQGPRVLLKPKVILKY